MDFSVAQCPWSYQQLQAMSPQELERIAADPKMRNAVRQLLEFATSAKGRIRKEVEGETPSTYPIWDENGLTESSYKDYLECPHWKEFRKKAIRAAKFECARCGKSPGVLHVHHKHYQTLGKESLEDVEVVCVECHEEEHGVPFTHFKGARGGNAY